MPILPLFPRNAVNSSERKRRDRASALIEARVQSEDEWWVSLIDVLYAHYSPEDDEPLTRMQDVVWRMPHEHVKKLLEKMVHRVEWDKHQRRVAREAADRAGRT